MKKSILATITIATVLAGCATNNYQQMSAGSGIQQSTLEENCKLINCSYDKLKDNVQAAANDIQVGMLLLSGNETRTIQYTWVSGWNEVSVDVFFINNLYSEWSFVDRAEIYVDKEMVATVSGQVDRRVGSYNEVARKHEKIEQITGSISIEAAEKIAKANYENVTIRFYGKGGYQDKVLPRKHNLIHVVNLAKSA